ncbi:MAG: hypothetical protein QOG65_302 [Actinomycetota bacterium]|jgi:hypothetical protein|nr:hypothetical protein [Actinomycetota bacterium]
MLLSWVALVGNAGAFTGGGDTGESGKTDVHLEVGAPGQGLPGQSGDDAGRPLIQYTIHWSTEPDAAHPGFDGACNAGTVAAPIFGFSFHFVGRDATGRIVDDRIECIAPTPGADPSQPPLPAIPAVPTFGEAWNSAQIPAPTVILDPATRGITGLDTRISTTGPTEVVIAAGVRGYTITGTVTLGHYEIAVDDQPPTNASNGRYVFETKGNHTVAISAVWHGTATITGPGSTISGIDMGTATLTSTRTYPVHEIRSVLQP